MSADQTGLAWFSVALAVIIVLISRLPRPVIVLVVTSTLGATLGLVFLVAGGTSTVICDYSGNGPPGGVDRCSGEYWMEMRLPQFMQGPKADTWLIAIAVGAGILVLNLIALLAMCAWRRVRDRGVPVRAPE